MTDKETGHVIRCMPGESTQDFIRRIVEAGGPPTPEAAETIRRLLPPVTEADDPGGE